MPYCTYYRYMDDQHSIYVLMSAKLLCWQNALSCTSQEFPLMPCPSVLEWTCVQSHFEFCSRSFAEARILDTPFAEVRNLLLVKTSTELQTECMDDAASWYLWLRLGYVQFFRDFNYCFQFAACYFVVYRITLTYNVSCHIWYIYIVRKFLAHHIDVWSYFHILDGFYWSLYVLFSYVDKQGEIWTVSFSSTKDQLKKVHQNEGMALLCLECVDELDPDDFRWGL